MDLETKYKELFELYKKGGLSDYDDPQLKNEKYDFKYKNFIPYPDLYDPDFNKKLYHKQEFYRNKSEIEPTDDFDKVSDKKCSQTTFTLDNFQKTVKTFMSPLTPYNSLLLYCGVGTGKTCCALSIAEQYHDVYKKPVLVILSSTLVDNFKKQMFDITKYNMKENEANLCLGTKYPDMVVDRQIITPEMLEKRVSAIIKERYKFMGYKELAIFMDKLEDLTNEQQRDESKRNLAYIEKVKENFSDRLIIIDEAHNLRVPGETGKKLISEAFLKLMKHVQNVKLVLLTATPMFNESTEIVWTLNLLLTNDRRPTLKKADIFDANNDITVKGTKILSEACRGYVSFMRGENPYSFPFRIFPSLNDPKDPKILKSYPTQDIYGKTVEKPIKFLEIIQSNMSDYQKTIYDVFKSKFQKDGMLIDDDDEDDETENNNDLKNTMQVSNVVYPYSEPLTHKDNLRKTYGRGGFENCFDITRKKYEYKKDIKQKYGEFFRYDKIGEYAPKIKTILDYVISSKGIVFIYSRYYPAGLVPLAMALEHIGLVKYSPGGNIMGNITVDNKFGNKKFKYIILSRRPELSPNNDLEIAAAKANDNMEGEKIKVVIVSKIGTEGIDFKRIREIHLLEPWFNLNRAEQIIGRGVRNCSHALLPKEKRNVTIYFHANCYSEKEESADLRTYRVAESKQKRIIQVETILKENAIDCNLNKNVLLFTVDKLKTKFNIETSQGKIVKNYKVGDKDNSFICGFKPCKMKCIPQLPPVITDVDKSTFEIDFITDDIEIYKKYISQIIRKKTVPYVYNDLLKSVKEYYSSIEEDIFKIALEEMVDNEYPIYNLSVQKYGFLINRGNKYIFQLYSIKDVRLGLEEREELEKNKQTRLKLDMKELLKAQKMEIIKPKSVSPINGQSSITQVYKDYLEGYNIILLILMDTYLTSMEDDEISELKTYLNKKEDMSEVEEGLKRYINNNKKTATILDKVVRTPVIIKELETKLDKYEQEIIDSVVDRLDKDQLIKILNYLNSKNKKEDEIYEMLKNSIKQWQIRDKHFFNPNDKVLYYLKDKKYVESTPLDRSKEIDEAYNLLKTIHSQKKLNVDIRGYMQIKKDHVVYKLRDNEHLSGAVCGTSQAIDDLINKLKELDPSLLKTYTLKYKKITLCYMIEILQRKIGIFDRKKN